MKSTIYFILASVIMLACNSKVKDKEDLPVDHNIPQDIVPAGPECYLKVVGRDSMIFQMEREGDSVHGVFNWKPYEKDIKMSNFKGTVVNGKGKAIAQVSAEGMNTNEEFEFTVQENSVSVKFGAMEQDRDGTWYYKKGEPTSEQVLPKTDCAAFK